MESHAVPRLRVAPTEPYRWGANLPAAPTGVKPARRARKIELFAYVPSVRGPLGGTRVGLWVGVALSLPATVAGAQGGYSVVYGVKTVTPTLTPSEAKQRGLWYGDVPKVAVTRLFTVDPSSGKTALVFSDEALPVMVLHREGGMETDLKWIVVTIPSRRAAIALMGNRPGPADRSRPTPQLYQLSLDGSNRVRPVASVGTLIVFAVSPDGAQIAYYLSDPHRLVVRSVDSGTVARAISLEGREFANLPVLSWSPDGRVVLVRRWPGPEHKTEYDFVYVSPERVEATGIRGEIYSFFPKSNRLLGVHLLYDGSSASPRRRFFSMALPSREALDLPVPQCSEAWHAEVSPDEELIAYPCDSHIVIAPLAGGDSGKAAREVPLEGGSVLGWINK